MKKLIALCAVFGFAATAHAEADLSNSGSFRLQYFNTDTQGNFDEDLSGRTHLWQQRFQWNIAAKAGEDVSFNAKLVHAAEWGENGGNTQTPYAGSGNNAQTENVLIVNEANATWMMSDEMSVRFGRGSATLGDGTVVAANEWEQVQKAFDGGIFMYDHEMARISAFGVRGADLTANSRAAYGNFSGIAFDFKSLPEALKMAHLHYVAIKTDATAASAMEDTSRIGLTLGGDTGAVGYRATYAMYSGEAETGIASGTDQDVEASMLDAEVSFSMPETMNTKFTVLYHTDSGDDSASEINTYSGFHYDIHNNAGVMDQVQWGNLTYLKVGVSLDPSENTTVGVDYYQFTATEENDNTLNGPNSVADATADDIGSEIDLWATKRYTDNFSITGWYAMFTPGDRITTATAEDDRTQLYFAANYSF